MVAYLGQGFTCILAVPTVRPTPKGESAGEAFFIGSMKYYLHHIGDFDRATRHLSRIERSVYSDLIDLYYDTEQQLPLDVSLICRKILARTNEESTAVEQTLNEFFTKTPTGWYHERCETVIDEYKANTSQKALAGRASAAKKALKRQQALNGESTGVEQTYNGTPTNLEPKTINQEPVVTQDKPANTDRKKKALKTQMPDDFAVSERVSQWAKENKFDRLGEHLDAFKRKSVARAYSFASWDDAFMEAILEDWAKIRTQPRGYQNADVARQTVPAKPGPDPMQAVFAERDRKAAPIPQAIREQMAKLTNMVK